VSRKKPKEVAVLQFPGKLCKPLHFIKEKLGYKGGRVMSLKIKDGTNRADEPIN
jgi:hypothetical protein